MKNITPLFGRVLVKEIKENMDVGLLIIPFAGYRDRGIVVQSNSDVVKVGDKIIYEIRYTRDVKIDDEDFISVSEEDILAIIEED